MFQINIDPGGKLSPNQSFWIHVLTVALVVTGVTVLAALGKISGDQALVVVGAVAGPVIGSGIASSGTASGSKAVAQNVQNGAQRPVVTVPAVQVVPSASVAPAGTTDGSVQAAGLTPPAS